MHNSFLAPNKQRRFLKGLCTGLAATLLCYLFIAYLLAPELWRHLFRPVSVATEVDRTTKTVDGHPGDPLNIALVGTEAEVRTAMFAAGWFAADPLSLKSDFKISEDTILKRVYDGAPVSNLYLYGRREDTAFEQPSTDNPRHRHHVRFWLSPQAWEDGRSVWFGSASFDDRVGFSHTTGQITHHIAANIDAERDFLMSCLEAKSNLQTKQSIENFHSVRSGRNGGGDVWETDGKLSVAVLEAQ